MSVSRYLHFLDSRLRGNDVEEELARRETGSPFGRTEDGSIVETSPRDASGVDDAAVRCSGVRAIYRLTVWGASHILATGAKV